MGKICSATAFTFSRRLSICAGLLLGIVTLGPSAFAASNRTAATLHIHVIVVPTVEAGTTSLPAKTSTQSGDAMFSLHPSSAAKMTSYLTVRQVSLDELDGRPVDSPPAGEIAIVQTTTIVAQ